MKSTNAKNHLHLIDNSPTYRPTTLQSLYQPLLYSRALTAMASVTYWFCCMHFYAITLSFFILFLDKNKFYMLFYTNNTFVIFIEKYPLKFINKWELVCMYKALTTTNNCRYRRALTFNSNGVRYKLISLLAFSFFFFFFTQINIF